jgi:hypothetical protein
MLQESITNGLSKAIKGYLAYEGSTAFYADDYPGYDNAQTVYTESDYAEVRFMWQSK